MARKTRHPGSNSVGATVLNPASGTRGYCVARMSQRVASRRRRAAPAICGWTPDVTARPGHIASGMNAWGAPLIRATVAAQCR